MKEKSEKYILTDQIFKIYRHETNVVFELSNDTHSVKEEHCIGEINFWNANQNVTSILNSILRTLVFRLKIEPFSLAKKGKLRIAVEAVADRKVKTNQVAMSALRESKGEYLC